MSDDGTRSDDAKRGATKPGSTNSDDSTADGGAPSGKGPDGAVVEPADDFVTTQHSIRIGRKTLRYTAVAGRMVVRTERTDDGKYDGAKPAAEVFVTAYTLDGAKPGERPVTFAFNGGPGSSSVWLHLGLFGPRRVVMGDVGDLAAPPYALADNAETLLAVSDLVLIDPVSTGISRPAAGEKGSSFHGFTGDIDSIADVVRVWTGRNRRWASPKFVAGESYGTTRAVALAERLQSTDGMYLNGVILISSVLDFGASSFVTGVADRAHALYLPHYAAVAHYHGKHGRRSLRSVLDEAEAYAIRDYPWALARGNRLTATERAEAVETVARLTGLSTDYVERADLRIEHWRYYGELLRDQRTTVGRLDSRFTGHAASAIAEAMDADPSMDAISGPYSTAYNHYVRDELGYESDLRFHTLSLEAFQAWSYKEFEGKPVQVVDKLERAMRQNPHLKVHIGYGYYDGATPYFAAEDTVAHLALPDELRANIDHAYYEAGHMMYVHEPSRIKQATDIAAFIRSACP